VQTSVLAHCCRNHLNKEDAAGTVQEFKALLAQEPSAVDALLQQHCQLPDRDVPGPLQRLQPMLDELMGQLAAASALGRSQSRVEALSSLQDSLQQVMSVGMVWKPLWSHPCGLCCWPTCH
jgi:hypothetical protein